MVIKVQKFNKVVGLVGTSKWSKKSKRIKYVTPEQFARKLSRKTGVELTAANVHGWIEGEAGYTKVDRAVKQWIGVKVYEEWETAARVLQFVCWKLGMVVVEPGTIIRL